MLETVQNPDVHSEDEEVQHTAKGHLEVKAKRGRNPLLGNVLHHLDRRYMDSMERYVHTAVSRDLMMMLSSSAGQPQAESGRFYPTILRPPTLTTSPTNVALDALDPDYFNNRLTLTEQAQFRHQSVSMPHRYHTDIVDNFDNLWHILRMDNATFMEEYGNETRSLYTLPDDTQIAALIAHGLLTPEARDGEGVRVGGAVPNAPAREEGDVVMQEAAQ